MAAAITMDRRVADKAMFDSASLTRQVRRGKLLHKLLLVLLPLSILPLLLGAIVLIHVGGANIQKQIVGVKMEIARNVANNVTSYLEDKKNTLTIVHKSSDFLTMDPARQTEILSNVMNAYPMFMRMTVIDLNGREITAVNRMGTPSKAAASQEEVQALHSILSLGDYVGSMSRSVEGYPQLSLGVPIEKIPGRPIGVLLGTINLIDLNSLIKDLVIDKNGYVYIVDMGSHELVAHPDVQMLLSSSLPPEVKAASLAPEETNFGAIEFGENNHQFLATYATVPRLNWRVFVQQPVEEAYQASTQMRHEIVWVMFLVAALTLALGLVISQILVKRVQRLQEAMEQVSEGNFDIPDVPSSNDEFGALTDRFIAMAGSLKDKTLKLVMAQRELQQWNSELEQRVQQRTKDLKEAQDQLIAGEKLAALGQMASVVGHELRNPLAVMNNSVYFLRTKLLVPGETPLDAKIEKHFKILETEIIKSNAIIRDVLDFARNRPLNGAPHVLDELMEKVLERIQIPADVTVRKDLALGPQTVIFDEDELRQVLVNLMENACQAMTSGGTLSIGTKAQKEWVEIVIGDTGCGIPHEHLQKIFAPFFTTKTRGTGLGLAVVKKIIERHQGTIEVESHLGVGTTFRIRLRAQPVAV